LKGRREEPAGRLSLTAFCRERFALAVECAVAPLRGHLARELRCVRSDLDRLLEVGEVVNAQPVLGGVWGRIDVVERLQHSRFSAAILADKHVQSAAGRAVGKLEVEALFFKAFVVLDRQAGEVDALHRYVFPESPFVARLPQNGSSV
jgi:hypothetical protein